MLRPHLHPACRGSPLDEFRSAQAVTFSGGTFTPTGGPATALYVGGAGNVVLKPTNNAAAVTFTGMLAGHIYRIPFVSITEASTTATNLVALT